MNDPQENRLRYHLGGPTALYRCSSYCKHTPPTVNAAPPTVNSALPTVNTAPPTANTAPPTLNVYSRRSRVYSRRSMFTVGGAPKQDSWTP